MRWASGNRGNIEDLRGRSGGRMVPLGIGGFVVLALLSWATGTDFLSLLNSSGSESGAVSTTGPVRSTPEEERMVDFVDAVAEDVQTTWSELLPSRYQRTSIVLFREAISSACGFAESATGPFYCPGDRKVYLDLEFFKELSQRFGAPGDFAQAYVIAHEIGHHVQNLLGLTNRESGPSSGPNSFSVALELQADCFAGVWGRAAAKEGGRVDLDPGDVDEGLQAAAAIGDDRLQKMATGRVMPERFTHGTSKQRVEWFKRGMESGDPNRCDTIATGTD
jgi:predicted metalloprotease